MGLIKFERDTKECKWIYTVDNGDDDYDDDGCYLMMRMILHEEAANK